MTTLSISAEWKLIDNEMQWRWRDLNKTSLSPKSGRLWVQKLWIPMFLLLKQKVNAEVLGLTLPLAGCGSDTAVQGCQICKTGSEWGVSVSLTCGAPSSPGRGWPPHVKYICLNVSVLHFYEAPLCVIPTDFSGILAVMELVIDIGM